MYKELVKLLELEPIETQYFFFNFLVSIDGKYYPKLNATQKGKLFKLIAEKCGSFGISRFRYENTPLLWNLSADFEYEAYNFNAANEDFDEALSDLVLQLIKNKILSKEQVRTILSSV